MEARRTAGKKLLALLCIIFLAVTASGCVFYNGSKPVSPGLVAVTIGPSALPDNTPTPVPSVVTAIPALSPGDEWYYENYSWDYKSVEWTFNLKISKSIYDFYKGCSHDKASNYADYVLTAEDKEFLGDVMAKFKNNSEASGFTGYDNAMNVLTFVQSIPYEEDTDGAEYTRYPIETLTDEKGDCKDKSILAAAMLNQMGYDVVLLKYQKHMAVGVKVNGQGTYFEYEGSRYYYAETTGAGWDIGNVPDDLQGVTPTIYPMEKSPKLESSLKVSPVEADGANANLMVICTVKNIGPGKALSLKAHVYALAPEEGPNKIWSPDKTIEIGDLAENQNGDFETTLTIPAGKRTQIVCSVSGDNVETNDMMTSIFYS